MNFYVFHVAFCCLVLERCCDYQETPAEHKHVTVVTAVLITKVSEAHLNECSN
jgi:hypothetical protein